MIINLRSIIGALTLAAAMTFGSINETSAQRVIFPQLQQPGAATVTRSGATYTLSNNLLSASFTEKDGFLIFDGCQAMGLQPETELFIVEMGDGNAIPASAFTMSNLHTEVLRADPSSPKGSEHFPGQALSATFTGNGLTIDWSAVLRDGSHYLRTEMELTSKEPVAMHAIIPMNYNVAAGEPVIESVGNTRGAILASSKIFAGLETPMGLNNVGGKASSGGTVEKPEESDGFTLTTWKPETFCWTPGRDVPSQILELGYDDSQVVGAYGKAIFASAGTQTVTFRYASGTHRLNIVGVDIMDDNDNVVASDYHFGFTGSQKQDNVYTLNVPKAATYTIRYFIEIKTESITSTGNISFSGNVTQPGPAQDPSGAVLPVSGMDRYWVIKSKRSERYVAESEGKLVSSPGIGSGEARWHFVKRADQTWDIINSATGHYINVAPYNSILTVTADAPEIGWQIKSSNTAPFLIITNGKVQFNCTTSAHSFEIWNWSSGDSGNDLSDEGALFSFEEVGEYDPDKVEFFKEDTGLTGRWSRNTNLLPEKPWKVSAVVGLVAPGQLRRSVASYVDRERAMAWRPMPIYNSWYELNINRNNDRNYTTNMNINQCLDVVKQWHTNLYDRHGANISCFLWDDGWDEYGTWSFNPNFPNGFAEVDKEAREMNTGIGAWLGPVGGYGQSGSYRRSYWNGKGGMQLSNPAYYKVFLDAVTMLTSSYDFRMFKFDGISAQFSSVGPDGGTTGEENAEAIIHIEQRVRQIKPDIYLNTTVGTWASPFWYNISDATWRQENDFGKAGPGNDREQWITYRDRLVHQNYVVNSPLCPINSIMTHGFILTKFGAVAKNMDYATVLNELRCAFASGTSMVELYADYSLLNEIEGGKLWADIAECIEWQAANADVLPDIHWVGGNPWTGSKAEVYGWASWNGNKATLTLRNGADNAQSYTFTLREALDIPEYVTTAITLSPSFKVSDALPGVATGSPIDIDQELTATLPAHSVFVFDGKDANAAVEFTPADATEAPVVKGTYDLQGRRLSDGVPTLPGIYIVDGRKVIVK